jgi:hypothetical protein
MDLTYWTYTEDETEDNGLAYINMVAGLRIEAPAEGSTIVWGTFLPKIAGKKSSFDVGLCELYYSGDRTLYSKLDENGEIDQSHWPTVQDFWYSEKEWFKNNISPAEQGQ